jgi:hypothetical protein
MPDRHEYDTGAVRSADCDDIRYDLITPIGLRAVARTCAEGAEKFGASNWEKGMPVTDLLNHAIAHIYNFLAGDRSEDHLGHAAWNVLGAIHSHELWPELNNGTLRGTNCSAPSADIDQPRASAAHLAAEDLERLRRALADPETEPTAN